MTAKLLQLLIACVSLALACSNEVQPTAPGMAWPASPPESLHGQRPATLVVPAQYSRDQAWPLLLALHGYTSNSKAMERFLDLQALVDQHGFVAVVPDGTTDPEGAQFWNIQLACCDFLDQGVDDIGYIQELLEEVTASVHIDPDRITLLGSSNGAYFSYQLACALPGHFRQIISVAGATPVDPDACQYPAPVSTIQVHGQNDSIVSYDNNLGTKDPDLKGVLGLETAGARATVARMQDYNGCSDNALDAGQRDYSDSATSAETHVQIWNNCSSGRTVELWSMRDTDHIIPFVANDAFRAAVGRRIAAAAIPVP